MDRLRLLAVSLGLTFALVAAPVGAQGIFEGCKEGEAVNSKLCGDDGTEASSIVKNLINTFLFVIGILAVAMIIHSGFKFVNSRGNPESIKAARETLLYSIIGLVVAILSFTIVNFVISAFDGTSVETNASEESDSDDGS